MNNIIQQFKGAGKLFFLLNVAIALLNLSVLKDNRHVSLLVLGENCQAVAAESSQLDAVRQFGGL